MAAADLPWVLLAAALALPAAACGSAGFGWQGVDVPRLRAYHAAFARDLGRRFDRAASSTEFVALTGGARALWLGDDHRDRALHGRQAELLRALRATGRPMCLMFEAVGEQDQPAIDAFLDGRGSIDDLAARVRNRWTDSWLDAADVDADHWRALLQFARAARIPVLALEPTPRLPLDQRDAVIARAVLAAAERHPGRLLVVVVGQSHLLGDGRLPERTGLPGPIVAAAPRGALLRAPRPSPATGFVRSDAGVWFFAELLVTERAPPAAAATWPPRAAAAAVPARPAPPPGRPRRASGS